jgi:trk system potassium uptake protein
MNLKHVLKIIAILLLIIAGFMLVPAGIAWYYNEMHSFYSFIITVASIMFTSSSILIIFRKIKKNTLSPRDGFLFVTLSWCIVAFFGALPFYISGIMPNFADAYFETISGLTTTGASILSEIQSLPRSILFWRSLTHWLGGMGIVVLTVAILPLLGIGGMQLIKAEAPGPTVDKITHRISETAKILWLIYLGMTIIETLLLMGGGMNLFNALTHTFGTMATGGFSPQNKSVGHFNSAYIDGVITVFMILAGINFTMYYKLLAGKFSTIFKDTELKAYLLIFFFITGLITYNLYSNVYDSISTSFRYASFQAASILTTTGYATTNFAVWPYFSQVLLFILMFIGGCSGSTGGGIKVIRIVTLLKQAINELKYLLHTRGIFTLSIDKKTIKKDIAYSISGFFFLYILMIIMTTLVVATSNHDIITSLTTALATLGNIGPGFGEIGPVENYQFYPDYVKWFLSFAMLIGRLELYTVLVIFTPIFWKK